MIITIIFISVFFFSTFTFFSGFGLATVLTPVFILFFPAPIAISLTAIVHLFNNIFKFILTAKNVNKKVLIKFGSTAILGAIAGSFTLLFVAQNNIDITYTFFKNNFHVELVNFIIGILILFFAILETFPQINSLAFANENSLYFGGMLSGFFGGLSGHQGAFRSIFLLKCNLSKEQFISTGVLIACLVDTIRLLIYGSNFLNAGLNKEFHLLFVAIIAALTGSYIANRYMQKITIKLIRNTIIIMLFIISTGLITGVIK